MRTDLDHLPPQKQRELERVMQLIFEEFDDAFALAKLDERLMREYGVTGTLKTPVNFIVHTLQEVNAGLADGRYEVGPSMPSVL